MESHKPVKMGISVVIEGRVKGIAARGEGREKETADAMAIG